MMTDEPTVRVWVRASWRLPTGQEITRTVKRTVAGDPDDGERRPIVLRELLEELQAAGHEFPEGHGTLVAILGTMTD